MANFFYFDIMGTKQGPVSQEQLKDLANQGIITPQSDLETDSGHRGKAGQIKGLFPPPEPSPFGNPAPPPYHTAYPQTGYYNGNNPFVWWWIVVSNYAGFSGRARRKEYWMFVLGNLILVYASAFMIGVTMGLAGVGEYAASAVNILNLALFLPALAVCVRRLHDIGKSGWWYLLIFAILIGWIILFVWFVSDSHPGNNKYGPNPKGR